MPNTETPSVIYDALVVACKQRDDWKAVAEGLAKTAQFLASVQRAWPEDLEALKAFERLRDEHNGKRDPSRETVKA